MVLLLSISVSPPALIVCRAALALNERAALLVSTLEADKCIADGSLLALVDSSEERLRVTFAALAGCGLDAKALYWLAINTEPPEWLAVSKSGARSVKVEMRGYYASPAGLITPPGMPI